MNDARHGHGMTSAGRRRPPTRGAARGIGAAAAALVLLALAHGPAEAVLYKWVDDKGIVHYSDQVPPDAVNKGSVQLNPQGVPIRKVDPASTPEQRRAREAEAEHQRDVAKQQEEQARRDKALLDSYTTESDIDLAKTRALRTIQAALDSAMGYSAQLTKRKAALVERKAALGGKPAPPDLQRDLASIEAELERQSAVIAEKNRQLVEVAAKYDADKAHWRALKGPPAAAASAPPAAATSAKATPAAPPSAAPAPPATAKK